MLPLFGRCRPRARRVPLRGVWSIEPNTRLNITRNKRAPIDPQFELWIAVLRDKQERLRQFQNSNEPDVAFEPHLHTSAQGKPELLSQFGHRKPPLIEPGLKPIFLLLGGTEVDLDLL